jgi:hypothetical protein
MIHFRTHPQDYISHLVIAAAATDVANKITSVMIKRNPISSFQKSFHQTPIRPKRAPRIKKSKAA